ncbi:MULTISPECIES: hypothetical protein [unclassified Marinobacter]|jgi:hypothetical protein|uniref:hypothetical protein n=1 Tax=unclassified Marinobacter TaxID=83889 RepID=UPI00200DB5E3|nr:MULTISPECIES: hypothetical protein [unclassified Marinobacter]UQG54990.1 hypothetical protein MIH16_16385 [Marinobacter sp. M4C]UQG63791.1 hypothetical protein MIH17_16370 [Marinobacter sp. M2C]UQG68074.1 hypothetical protein MIH19_16385 [Marinobacter sp. M1C]
MINAHIEMDLNQHISVVSSKIIELVESGEEMILETLMRKFLKAYEFYTPDQFMDGLVFLFSIDCLNIQDYRVVLKNV